MRLPSINEIVLIPASIWLGISLWVKYRRERKRDKAARERRKAEVIQFTSKAREPKS